MNDVNYFGDFGDINVWYNPNLFILDGKLGE